LRTGALGMGTTLPPRGRSRWSPNAAVSILAIVLLAALVLHSHSLGASNASSLHAILDSAALLAAMMMPLAGSSADEVAQRSLRDRRLLAVSEHVAGFIAVWFVFGIVATTTIGLLASALRPSIVFGALITVAAAWQLSARRRRYLERCSHLRTAPPMGWRSDVDTALAGMQQAVRCVRTCWASMVAMTAASHVVVMGIMFAAYLSEWAPGPNPFTRTRRYRPVPTYIGLALGALVVSVSPLHHNLA
jgi:predicted metal-binding membrane protein